MREGEEVACVGGWVGVWICLLYFLIQAAQQHPTRHLSPFTFRVPDWTVAFKGGCCGYRTARGLHKAVRGLPFHPGRRWR